MPISYRIVADSVDELAEPLRKVAKPVDGKFVIDTMPEGFGLEDVRGLKNTVQTLRGENGELKAIVKTFEEAGLTREEAKAAADALGKMKAGALKSTAEVDSWKQTVEDKFKSETQKLNDRLAKRSERLRNELVRGKLAPIIAAKGGAEAMDAILTLAERNIRVEEDSEGNLVPIVVGNDGKTAAVTKKVGSMDPMGFDELVDLMRESPQTKGLFRVQAAGGSGAVSQSGGSARAAGIDITKMSSADLIAMGNRAH